MSDIDLLPVIETIRLKRPLFHSEADFQFALAWEIQRAFPSVDIRLEYPPESDPNKYIDILVRDDGHSYPIELKYKTKKLSVSCDGEKFHLKNHGAQDLGVYDFVKDICRLESFSNHIDGFKCGYVLWLSNDSYYWNAPSSPEVGYAAFSVHHGAKKSGTMNWGSRLSAGTIRGREQELILRSEYEITWHDYSDLGIKCGLFKYALLRVEEDS